MISDIRPAHPPHVLVDAAKDALPYHNGSFKFRVGPINCSVLCGGISYTALDYFETDKAVDAKQVGLAGHSRFGKTVLVAMAYDPRFAIAYSSSSGATQGIDAVGMR